MKEKHGLEIKSFDNGQKMGSKLCDGKSSTAFRLGGIEADKSSEINYHNDNMDSPLLVRTVRKNLNQTTRMAFTTNWYSSGQKLKEVSYMEGKRHGLEIAWYKCGQKLSETNYSLGEQIRRNHIF